MEAMVDPVNETIWATQRAMAELFGVNTQAITKHLGNIFEEGELVKEATCSKMEQVRKEGSRTVSRKIDFYNLTGERLPVGSDTCHINPRGCP